MADYVFKVGMKEDGTNSVISIGVFDSAGNEVTNVGGQEVGWLKIQLAAFMGKQVEVREIECKNQDGATKFFMALRSSFYDTKKTANPEKLGGGGGSLNIYTFRSMQGDYLVCRPILSPGGPDEYIAKPASLRFSIANETIFGQLYTYSAYDAASQTRNSTASGETEFQRIIPPYLTDQLIMVSPVAEATGIVGPGGVAVTKIDINNAGRAWSRVS